jgi:hypothetical protein
MAKKRLYPQDIGWNVFKGKGLWFDSFHDCPNCALNKCLEIHGEGYEAVFSFGNKGKMGRMLWKTETTEQYILEQE